MTSKAGWYIHVHPVFRILCFLVFSLFLALGGAEQLLVATVIVAALAVSAGAGFVAACWPMLRRMRWFLLSIFIIYAWMTPGQAPLSHSAWLPTQAGMVEGLMRMLALIFIVVTVQWLLWVTAREQLVAALYWLARPLAWFGLSRERFAVRMALILLYVVEVQMLVAQEVRQAAIAKGDVRGYAGLMAGLLQRVVMQAEQQPCDEIELEVAAPPPAWQWCLPALVAGLMVLAGGV